MEELEIIFLELKEKMIKSVDNYNLNLSKISAGRPNPKIFDSIKIDYYGELTSLFQIANISIPEARQFLITPYDTNLVKTIVGVINTASLGLFAMDEGDKIRIKIPDLTTERRKELVKLFTKYTEQAKIFIRHVRQEANKLIKNLEFSEDEEKKHFQEVQKETNKYIEKIVQRSNEKKDEIMHI